MRASDVVLSCDGTRFLVNGETPVRVRHLGRHAVLNALAALAVAQVAGVPLAQAVEGAVRGPLRVVHDMRVDHVVRYPSRSRLCPRITTIRQCRIV